MSNDPANPTDAARRSFLLALEEWLWSGELVPACDVATVAQAVEELSDLYTVERGLIARRQGDREHLVAKLLYFLASDAPKVALVLDECAARDDAYRTARCVIDVGCGVGATSVGFLHWLVGRPRESAPITIIGVDQSPSVLTTWARVVTRAAALAPIDARIETRCADLGALALPAQADLVLCQTALNESLTSQRAEHSDSMVATLTRWARVAPLVVIEPGLRATTRALHSARDRLLAGGGLRIVAPCPHQLPCPMLARPDDWCHESRRVEPTPRVAAVQKLTRRRDERAVFSFLALAPGERELPGSLGTCRIVSDPLGSRGKTERWVCRGDGTLHFVRVLDRERCDANEALLASERGTLVELTPFPDNDRAGRDVRVAIARGDRGESSTSC